jgi:hypothetical protein
MVNVSSPPTLNTWVKTTWDDFAKLAHHADFDQARFYYELGWMRIETLPIGSAHG